MKLFVLALCLLLALSVYAKQPRPDAAWHAELLIPEGKVQVFVLSKKGRNNGVVLSGWRVAKGRLKQRLWGYNSGIRYDNWFRPDELPAERPGHFIVSQGKGGCIWLVGYGIKQPETLREEQICPANNGIKSTGWDIKSLSKTFSGRPFWIKNLAVDRALFFAGKLDFMDDTAGEAYVIKAGKNRRVRTYRFRAKGKAYNWVITDIMPYKHGFFVTGVEDLLLKGDKSVRRVVYSKGHSRLSSIAHLGGGYPHGIIREKQGFAFVVDRITGKNGLLRFVLVDHKGVSLIKTVFKSSGPIRIEGTGKDQHYARWAGWIDHTRGLVVVNPLFHDADSLYGVCKVDFKSQRAVCRLKLAKARTIEAVTPPVKVPGGVVFGVSGYNFTPDVLCIENGDPVGL